LSITCNVLYCNHQVHSDFLIALYNVYGNSTSKYGSGVCTLYFSKQLSKYVTCINSTSKYGSGLCTLYFSNQLSKYVTYINSTSKYGSGMCTLYFTNQISKCVTYTNRTSIKANISLWHFPCRNYFIQLKEEQTNEMHKLIFH